MQFKKTSLATAFAVVVSFAMAACGQDGAWAYDPGAWRVTQVDGEAWLRNQGPAARPVHKGDRLAAGGFVITGDGGLVSLTRAGVAMTLLPDGRAEIPSAIEPRGPMTIMLRSGSLQVQVEPSAGASAEQPKRPVFRVETPFLTANVVGTVLSVRVEEDGASVFVATGKVEVRSITSGEVALIRAGQSANVSRDGGGRLQVFGAH